MLRIFGNIYIYNSSYRLSLFQNLIERFFSIMQKNVSLTIKIRI